MRPTLQVGDDAVRFYSKMSRIRQNGNGHYNNDVLRPIIRSALKQVDRTNNGDKKVKAVREVLADLLQYHIG